VTGGVLTDITIFVLSLLVGFEVISKVPATLHTPLMSAANSIHGIVLVGAMLIAASAHSAVGYVLAFIAAAFAAMNVVGGYAVTERMLQMFRRRPIPSTTDPTGLSTTDTTELSTTDSATPSTVDETGVGAR
jgi:NAD(P) transhydrogenase subunit alpha